MQVKIKNCRLSFSNLRKPYVPKTGDPKFTFTGICSPDTQVEVNFGGGKELLSYTKFSKVVDAVCKEKWGKTPAKLEMYVFAKADMQVGSRGAKVDEDGEYYDGYDENTWFFSAGTKVADAPTGIMVIDQKREPLPAAAGHPLNGDYVNAIINVFAYEYEGKKGISASVEAVQYLRKGIPFGAEKVGKDAFDDELEDEDMDDDSI